jgi:hypothetical protein
MMQRILAVCFGFVVACGGADTQHPHAVPPKPSNDILIVGAYGHQGGAGTSGTQPALSFDKDGNVKLVKDKTKLDGDTLASGTYTLEKDQLRLLYTEGACAQDGPGVYTITVSKIGIRFVKVDDACESRARMDGEIWRRL